MGGVLSGWRDLLSSPRGILLTALVLGLVVRGLVMPFTYEYDMYHWSVVMQNIDSGNDLYELNGYFYTPVWGYFLGAIGAFWNTFLSVDIFGIQFSELLGVEDMENMNHVATIISPEFSTALKIPLVLVDLAAGALVYLIVRDLTSDDRKASIGFALWFLCPIVIYMSSIQGTFDNISGLLTLLSVFLVLRRHYYAGGFILMTAILLKLYPGFALTVIIALIYAREGMGRTFLRDLMLLFAGGISAFAVLMAPTFLDGTFTYAFTFITDRSGSFSGINGAFGLLGMGISLAVMLYFTYAMAARGREDTDRRFLRCVILALVGGILANTGPQYPIVLLPLLCVYIIAVDRTYAICWALIGFGCALQALVLNNYSLLMEAAAYWGWPSFDFVLDGLDWTEEYIFGTNSFRSIMNSVFSMIAIAGLVLAILFHFNDWLSRASPMIGGIVTRIRNIEIIGGI